MAKIGAWLWDQGVLVMTKIRTWFLHFGLAVVVILGIILTVHLLSRYGVGVANHWLTDIHVELNKPCFHYSYDAYVIATGSERTIDATSVAREEPIWRRLREQCSHTRKMALFYEQMMVYHYVSYYVALTMAALLAILAGIFLFSITKSGWQAANQYTVTVFLILAGATLFFSQEPSLFEHEKNITHYTAQFTAYAGLERRILRFMANGSEVIPPNPQPNDAAQPQTNEETQVVAEMAVDSVVNGDVQSEPSVETEQRHDAIANFVYSVDQQLSDMDQLLLLFNSNAVPSYTELVKQLNSLGTTTAATGP